MASDGFSQLVLWQLLSATLMSTECHPHQH